MLELNKSGQTYFNFQNNWLVDVFSNGDVAVIGGKRKGKDLLFQHVINLRNDIHYSPVPYSKKTIICPIKNLSCGGNTFYNMLTGNYKLFDDKFKKGKDFYIPDCGIFLPSQYNDVLDDLIPDLGVFMCIESHFEHRSHFNCQNFERLYLKSREQASTFIRAIGVDKYATFLIINVITYELGRSAEANLLPIKQCANEKIDTFLERQNDSDDKFGEIRYRSFLIEKRNIYYDTHYFAKLLQLTQNSNTKKYF